VMRMQELLFFRLALAFLLFAFLPLLLSYIFL